MSEVEDSGDVLISSGDGSSLGGSGMLSMESGDVSGVNVSSGVVSVGSGDSMMGSGGDVSIQVGSGQSGKEVICQCWEVQVSWEEM